MHVGKIYNVFRSSWVPLQPTNLSSLCRQSSYLKKETETATPEKEMVVATTEPSSVEGCEVATVTKEQRTVDSGVTELNSTRMEAVMNNAFEFQMNNVLEPGSDDGQYSMELISCGTQDSNTHCQLETHSGMECSFETNSDFSYDTKRACSVHRRKRLISSHWNEPGVKRSRLEQRAVRRKDTRKMRKKLTKRIHKKKIHRRSVRLLKKTRRKCKGNYEKFNNMHSMLVRPYMRMCIIFSPIEEEETRAWQQIEQ